MLWAFYYPLLCVSSMGERGLSRLLLIADPQLEGDSRIEAEGLYGRLALWMDDVYMKHIVQRTTKLIEPTEIFVLGDIFGHFGKISYIDNRL